VNWRVAEHLKDSLRSGEPAVGKVLPEGFWSHFAKNEEDARIFDAAMTAKAQGHIAGILAAYDFGQFKTIADIGGGAGHLLKAALDAAPQAQGVLFDLPGVVEKAAAPASPRLTRKGGDFFKDALPAADGYLIMEVIHDWPDAESVAILSAIRRAAPKGAKLLLIEQIIPDTPGPDWSKALDVLMLINLGGKQRTIAEYRALLGKAGFRLEREIKTPGISILEATPTS
jgi:O-methyltransferase